MTFAFITFLNLAMLAGLAAVGIPILIHLLNRRRFEVIDWGAMQFLQVSETTRRRLLIEEILLMALRMGLIALMVLALAAPFTTLQALPLGGRQNRDLVLIFDGSTSMSYTGTGTSAQDAGKEWALAFIRDHLVAGDSVALLQAKQQVVPILAEPTHDLEAVRGAIGRLPEPRGGVDWPLAIQHAVQVLAKSKRPQRDVIVIGDGQRFGWADEGSLLSWELHRDKFTGPGPNRPRIWVVNVAPDRPADPPNWSLGPITSSRAVAAVGQEIRFRLPLELHGQNEYQPPHRLRLEIDGRPATDLSALQSAKLEKGKMPFSFTHRFATPGSHLVTVIVEPDPPPNQRPSGYRIKDHLPGDNRQDFALEVLHALPVLIVDGDTRPMPRRRGSDFLKNALAPPRDPTPSALVQVVPIQDFDPAQLFRNLGKEAGTQPRVLILADVPRLSPGQEEAVLRFLNEGGGVLVTLGERADPAFYNQQFYRGGQGWLPARVEALAGNEAEPGRATRPEPTSFFHPTLEIFRDMTAGGLGDARLPSWWQLAVPGRGSPAVPIAFLTSKDPFLVERPYRHGRVMQVAVPLDDSWKTNLPELPAYVPLVHELVYYLAGARSADSNLPAGQPIRYRPAETTVSAVTMHLPGGEARNLRPTQWPLVFEDTKEVGIYRLERSDGKNAWYVVPPDPRESDLTPAAESDREKVRGLVEMTYTNDPTALASARDQAEQSQELWWLFLLGVVVLLCGEVWLTRRIVKNR